MCNCNRTVGQAGDGIVELAMMGAKVFAGYAAAGFLSRIVPGAPGAVKAALPLGGAIVTQQFLDQPELAVGMAMRTVQEGLKMVIPADSSIYPAIAGGNPMYKISTGSVQVPGVGTKRMAGGSNYVLAG